MTDLPRPPAHVEPFVRVLGVDDTVTLLSELGGAGIYIGRNPKGQSRLVQLLGRDKAEALASLVETGEWPARIPLAKPWVAQVLRARGLPVLEIARILRTTDVTVRKYLNPAPPGDPRQPQLF